MLCVGCTHDLSSTHVYLCVIFLFDQFISIADMNHGTDLIIEIGTIEGGTEHKAISKCSVWARNWKRWDTCLTKLKKLRHMSRPTETHVSPSWKRWGIHQAEKVIETLATRTRRLRGDQIEVFKILNGYENIDSNIFFLEIKQSKITRGHNITLVKKQSRLDVRKFSFSQRTINVWNKLST